MYPTKIETDDDPIHEDYRQSASVWFGTGGRIRFVETTDGRVIQQSYHPTDTDTVYDDVLITDSIDEEDYNFDGVFVTSLEVWFKDDFPVENDTLLAQAAGEEFPSTSNVRYME